MEPVPVTELAQLRELLQQQRIDELLAATRNILERQPQQRDALLFQALAQRLLGRIPEALEALDRLQEVYPAFSRQYEERGRCCVAR